VSLKVLGDVAEFEREVIRLIRAHRRGQGARRQAWPKADAHPSSAARGDQAPRRPQGNAWRNCALLQCEPLDDFEALKTWLRRQLQQNIQQGGRLNLAQTGYSEFCLLMVAVPKVYTR